VADTNLRIDIASEFTGAKAFKKAQDSTSNLEKNVKNLGRTLGITLGSAAIIKFAKESVKAFIADDKAATILANTMKNLGLEMSAPRIEQYVQSLEKATGVVDDQLRPAMQTLLQVTGSVTNSQKILTQAIEVSRATGVDLTTVAQDLGQAYVGNTRGLRKYSLGLTQAELKTASFTDITDRMTKLFGGANEAYLSTYAGQMERLAVAAGEAQEAIGKGLVDALANLGGGGAGGIDKIIKIMEDLSFYTGKFIRGFGGQIGALGKLLTGDFRGALALLNSSSQNEAYKGAIPSISGMVQASEQKKAEAAAVKRNKELLAAQNKQLKATKAITASKKASAIFDMDQIQIVAALKGRITEEERVRLQLQSAILMGNNDEARRLTIELSKTVGMSQELSYFLRNLPDAKNPFELWSTYLDAIISKVRTIQIPPAMSSQGQTGFADFGGAAFEKPTNPFGTGSYYGATGRDMPSNLNIVVTGGDAITQQLRFDLIGSSASGSASSLNRTTSSF
jgi:hypothetical protein